MLNHKYPIYTMRLYHVVVVLKTDIYNYIHGASL